MNTGIAFDLGIDDLSECPLPGLPAIGRCSVIGAHHDTEPQTVIDLAEVAPLISPLTLPLT